MKEGITAVILTYNEEKHIRRCLDSLIGVCEEVVIVDSFSDDKTEEIALRYPFVRILKNKWLNYSTQFNWGIENGEINSEWILRIDADEYLSEELRNSINQKLPSLNTGINGLLINRLMFFLDAPLKKGGMYPIRHLRLWRNGYGFCEET